MGTRGGYSKSGAGSGWTRQFCQDHKEVYKMRELRRSIARNLMEMHGIEQINKKKFSVPFVRNSKKRSYFSLHWRDYLNPESDQRKDLRKKLERRAVLYGKAGLRM